MARSSLRTAFMVLALGITSVAATQQAHAGPKDLQNALHPQKPGPGLGPKDFQNAPKPGPKFGHKHHGGHWGGMTAGLIGGAVLGAVAAQAYAPADCTLETRAFQDGYGNLFYRQVQVCEE